MRKVLLVSYYYPPRPGVASNRIGGLAKYLPQFGWEAIILTPRLDEGTWAPYATVVETEYRSALGELKRTFKKDTKKGFQQQIGIARPGENNFVNWCVRIVKDTVAYPDDSRLWLPLAIPPGLKTVRDTDVSAVISSSAPFTTHLIAKALKLEAGIPWIADLRDLWTQNHNNGHTQFRTYFERKLERKTLGLADHLVTVSSPLADKLQKLHSSQHVSVITNGFDPDEIYQEADCVDAPKCLSIAYTGQIYTSGQDPRPLLKVLHELIQDRKIDRDLVRLEFYGQESSELREVVEYYQLTDVVRQHGIVARCTAIEQQRKASALLLLNWDRPEEEGVYTGKIFEYLAARKPVLSIGGTGGVVKELLDTTNTGVHIRYEDDLRNVLLQWYSSVTGGSRISYEPEEKMVNEFSHKRMAEKFAALLDEVTNSR